MTTALTGSAARRIDYRPLAELKADPRNPKAHNLDTIDQSIGRFGMVEAVVLDGRTGYIISGHGRTETLKRMEERGEGTPEGIHVDEDGRWLAPVITGWSSRTDSEAAAVELDLRTTELGGRIDDALLAMLDDLSTQDDGLSGVGYDETDIDDLRARLEELTVEVDHSDGTKETPSVDEYAARYAEQGQRMVVMEFSQEDYAEVVARLKSLREKHDVDNNAAALRAELAEQFPEATADAL